MMMNDHDASTDKGLTRRDVLRRLGLLSTAALAGPAVLAACGGDDDDDDTAGTSEVTSGTGAGTSGGGATTTGAAS